MSGPRKNADETMAVISSGGDQTTAGACVRLADDVAPAVAGTRHVIVVDLGYGDAGKGGVVDWLCATGRYRTVVRFNGGAQAGHNVITPEGWHHTFSQFGSGTFTPGVRTHLSRYMIVDPLALTAEEAHLRSRGVTDGFARLTVDQAALLATPYHQAANRAREVARGLARHGSCGMGVGEAVAYALRFPADAPRAGDCLSPRRLLRKLMLLRDYLVSELGDLDVPPAAELVSAYRLFGGVVRITGPGYLTELLREAPAVFEGAQGVLLDQWHGFHPYTTWSSTTFANASALLAEADMTATRLGVTRCFQTRHGPGPFVTEDRDLRVPERHNRTGRWQGPVRTGHFDAVALRYAAEVAGGVDAVAVTHLDTARRFRIRVCAEYEADGTRISRLVPGPPRDLEYSERLTRTLLRATPVYRDPAVPWPELVAATVGAPVALCSWGAARQHKHPATSAMRAHTPASAA